MAQRAKKVATVLRDPFLGKFESIRVGDRIGIITGPGQFPAEGHCRTGKVYGKEEGRFGRSLRVKMDDFTFESVHGLTEDGSIGAYLIAEHVCAQCDSPLPEEEEVFTDGFGGKFCSEHCLNSRRGDACAPGCGYCADNEID